MPLNARHLARRISAAGQGAAGGDSSNVDLALTRFARGHTQVKRSGFKYLFCLGYLVAGTGFEPVTFRL